MVYTLVFKNDSLEVVGSLQSTYSRIGSLASDGSSKVLAIGRGCNLLALEYSG